MFKNSIIQKLPWGHTTKKTGPDRFSRFLDKNKQTDRHPDKQAKIYIDIDIEEKDGCLTEALVKVSICLWKA